MKGECQCGQLAVELAGSASVVVACHCVDCQRRSGSPFGVTAYYPADQVTVMGRAKRFERESASGGVIENFFCPECGSTVFTKAGKHPGMIGVPIGAIADPAFQPPVVPSGSSRCIIG